MADKQTTYTFGDNDLAAERLRILARAFEPTTSAFLQRVIGAPGGAQRLQHVIDLCCGPGYTTRLLRDVLAPGLTTGLDRSPRFLARAQLWPAANLQFHEHDVTTVPFPTGGADLLFARFLLTHLPAPAAVLRGWATAAPPGAHLLLEETAALTSADPALQRYYDLVAALQRLHGQELAIGQSLEALADSDDWIVRDARLTAARLPARLMARIHVMNLRTWRHDDMAARLCDDAALDALESALEQLACGRDQADDVTCRLKQVWLTRSASAAQPRPGGAAETAARVG